MLDDIRKKYFNIHYLKTDAISVSDFVTGITVLALHYYEKYNLERKSVKPSKLTPHHTLREVDQLRYLNAQLPFSYPKYEGDFDSSDDESIPPLGRRKNYPHPSHFSQYNVPIPREHPKPQTKARILKRPRVHDFSSSSSSNSSPPPQPNNPNPQGNPNPKSGQTPNYSDYVPTYLKEPNGNKKTNNEDQEFDPVEEE
ncbi:uncharacterized protein LOC110686478 [Chenopodium quinoa]|uniref:uncharacterized protein LOC110686478 n=1 Tax=Chenopodium quinoa TaxID=63459 RepID=UPI000B770D64|nr:uncharacterized protein LOC110686478 [Chenopodium quinoa]